MIDFGRKVLSVMSTLGPQSLIYGYLDSLGAVPAMSSVEAKWEVTCESLQPEVAAPRKDYNSHSETAHDTIRVLYKYVICISLDVCIYIYMHFYT